MNRLASSLIAISCLLGFNYVYASDSEERSSVNTRAIASVVDKSEAPEQFSLANAIKYAEKHGERGITKQENNGMSPYRIVCDDSGRGYAVLKGGGYSEAFIFKYAEAVGLKGLVAPSYSVKDLQVKGLRYSFRGMVEAFVPAIPYDFDQSGIPGDIKRFVDKYEDSQGTLPLCNLVIALSTKEDRVKAEEDRLFFFKHINKEHLDHIFLLYVLTYLGDMTNHNALVTLNAEHQFEFRIIDTESCFVLSPSYQTFMLGFPHASAPLSSKAKALIPGIIQKMPDYREEIEELFRIRKVNSVEGGFEQQMARMRALSEFLELYPQASPRSLVVFAFWNTFFPDYDEYIGEHVPHAYREISSLPRLGFEDYGIEIRPQFDDRVHSLFRYSYSSMADSLKEYHEKTEDVSFEGLINFMSQSRDFQCRSADDILTLLQDMSEPETS